MIRQWLWYMISAIGLVRHWFSKHGDIKTNFNVGAVLSTIVTLATATFNPDAFVHPRLTDAEHREGSRLGIDSWADTACAGKHAFVEEFVMGKFITAKGFTQALGQLDNLPMANVLYAYDTHDGNVLILEANNCIYLGDQMEDYLANPIQAEEIGVRVDTRPKRYYPDDPMAQTIRFCDGTSLPVLYDGVLPYLPVRRPTKDEIHSCKRLVLSSKLPWDPFSLEGNFSRINLSLANSTYSNISNVIDDIEADPIGTELMSVHLSTLLSLQPVIHHYKDKEEEHYGLTMTINAIRAKEAGQSITPEEMCKMLHIGLQTAKRTLNATTASFIRTTGSMTRRFRTDKAHLRYKQLSKVFGSFIVTT